MGIRARSICLEGNGGTVRVRDCPHCNEECWARGELCPACGEKLVPLPARPPIGRAGSLHEAVFPEVAFQRATARLEALSQRRAARGLSTAEEQEAALVAEQCRRYEELLWQNEW